MRHTIQHLEDMCYNQLIKIKELTKTLDFVQSQLQAVDISQITPALGANNLNLT